MKNTFIKSILKTNSCHSKLVFISVDQETGFDDDLSEILGDRFLIESISEQNVIGFASGLSADGYLPVVFNHAAFTIRRSYEQILLDCCLQNRKVILLGMGGGFATAHLGPSHTTFDDLALTSIMPNMETFIPCGSFDIDLNFEYLLTTPNSVYVRLSKYGKNNLKEYNQLLDSKIFYRKFGSIESEICVFSTGPISYNVFEAIINTNINILHIHIPFLKNIEQNNIELLCKSCKKILVYEEHSKFGGLFSALSPIFLKSVFFKNVEIINFGINNSFLHKYGSQEDVWKYYKLDTNSIIETLIKYK